MKFVLYFVKIFRGLYMTKENQRVILTKRLLKEGLLRLLEKKDIQKINICELCEVSGINRATFYRHYETPFDLLIDIGKDVFYQMQSELQMPSSVQEVESYIEGMCKYLYENADVIRILLRNTSENDALKYVREIYQMLLGEYNKSAGVYELDADTIWLMSTYLGGGGYFLLRQWLMEDIQKSPEEMAALTCKLLNAGKLLQESVRMKEGK